MSDYSDRPRYAVALKRYEFREGACEHNYNPHSGYCALCRMMAQRDIAFGDLPYPESDGRTHHADCWRDRGHHNCAVLEADRLAADLAKEREDHATTASGARQLIEGYRRSFTDFAHGLHFAGRLKDEKEWRRKIDEVFGETDKGREALGEKP
jgi:hypothetical protein